MKRMKNSSVAWIGDVPEGWRVQRLRTLVRNVVEKMPIEPALKVPLENLEPWSGKLIDDKLHKSNEGCSQGFSAGDVLFSKLRPYLAKVFYAPSPGSCSGEMLVLRSHGIDAKFLSFVLTSPLAIEEINSMNYGAKMPRANWDVVGNLHIPIPSMKEQKQIVDYLQFCSVAIDDCVIKRRQVIDKLKEYKKSLIAHVVTKGLDTKIKMKESGISWLGEIPHNWTIHYPKALFVLRKERMRKDDEQLTASQEHGMILQSEFQEREGRKVVQVILNSEILKHVEPGDFVMHMRSFQGGLELAKRGGCVSSAYVMLRPRDDRVRVNYYKYLFKSSTYINALRSTSNLVRDGQALRYANFIQIYLPLPPVDIQEAIATYLDERCNVIDEAISRQEQIIEKLVEYRKSIIHHAVTGKIDCMEPKV